MVAKFYMRERKVSNFIFILFSTYLIYIYLLLRLLQQDGCRLSVLFAFLYVYVKRAIFPA